MTCTIGSACPPEWRTLDGVASPRGDASVQGYDTSQDGRLDVLEADTWLGPVSIDLHQLEDAANTSVDPATGNLAVDFHGWAQKFPWSEMVDPFVSYVAENANRFIRVDRNPDASITVTLGQTERGANGSSHELPALKVDLRYAMHDGKEALRVTTSNIVMDESGNPHFERVAFDSQQSATSPEGPDPSPVFPSSVDPSPGIC